MSGVPHKQTSGAADNSPTNSKLVATDHRAGFNFGSGWPTVLDITNTPDPRAFASEDRLAQ